MKNFLLEGFILKDDTQINRCYIADILSRSTAGTYPCWRIKLIGYFDR
jgi:hypothetical protein